MTVLITGAQAPRRVGFVVAALLMPMGALATPDLLVEKTVDNPTPIGNESVEFTIRVSNVGDEPALSVMVQESLPDGLAIPDGMAAFPSTGVYDPLAGSWDVGDLGPAQDAVLTLPAMVVAPVPAACLVNQASSSLPEDLNPDNDEARAAIRQPGTERCVDLDFSYEIWASEPLKLYPTCDSQDRYQGWVLVKNHGPDDARDVELMISEDPVVGPNLRFEDSDCTNVPGDTCNISIVQAGGAVSISVTSDLYRSYTATSTTRSISVSTVDTDYDTANDSRSNTVYLGGFSSCASNIDLSGIPDVGIGPGCFIATAAYGSALDPHVESLRVFRDRYLVTNAPGRTFVALYYRYSPPIADYIATRPWARTITRWALAPLLLGVSYPVLSLGLVLLFLASTLLWRRTRRRGLPAA